MFWNVAQLSIISVTFMGRLTCFNMYVQYMNCGHKCMWKCVTSVCYIHVNIHVTHMQAYVFFIFLIWHIRNMYVDWLGSYICFHIFWHICDQSQICQKYMWKCTFLYVPYMSVPYGLLHHFVDFILCSMFSIIIVCMFVVSVLFSFDNLATTCLKFSLLLYRFIAALFYQCLFTTFTGIGCVS